MGHTPFGHAGEELLNRLYHAHTGRYFNHNVHSVRVLDKILELNMSLQTLDGILCHNGEMSLSEYVPQTLAGFEEFDKKVERCYTDKEAVSRLVPNTLEGCVVRISDIIAYIGKDRQDAYRAGFGDNVKMIEEGALGASNTNIISTLINNIVENSYGKPYIRLDKEYQEELEWYKELNYEKIYLVPELKSKYDDVISAMFDELYHKLLEDVKRMDAGSIIYRHHILDIVRYKRNYVKSAADYTAEEPNQIVVDYIASMTDDYFLALYKRLFPDSKLKIEFKSYFDD
jgi:dGTPase